MNILLAYATYSSGTESASKLIEEVLAKTHTVTRKNIKEVAIDELANYDSVVFGTPSWWNRKEDGQPHEFFLTFMDSANGKSFPNKKFAVFGLGDTAYTRFTHGATVLEEFVATLGGTLVTQTLRIDGYYFEQSENEKKVIEWAQNLSPQL